MSDNGRPSRIRALGRLAALLLTLRTLWRSLRHRAAPPAPPESDVDPSGRTVPGDRRAEALVAGLLLAAAGFGFGFTVLYIVLGTNTQLLGLAFGGALLLLAAALIVAGKAVVPQETSVEDRGPLLQEQETEEVVEMVEAGGEGVSRRVLLTGAGGLAGAAMVTAAATPIASLGPKLDHIHDTPWQKGVRLVDDQGRPYAASSIEVGTFYTALPEGGDPEHFGAGRLVDDQGRPYAASSIEVGTFYTALPEGGDPEHFGAGLLVVRLLPAQIHLPPARRDWAPDGILAYSKICPHAGCAISLYRYPTYRPTSAGPAFTCPCHYSTFAPGEGGRLIFGPAGRSLPQLPLAIDGDGNLRAAGPFHEDIGPSWWNVHRSQS